MAKRPSPPTADAPPRAPRKAGRPTSAKPPRPRAARAAPAPETPEPTPPPPQAEAPANEAFAFPGADQRQMLETLSMNLAKAAMTAQ